MGVLTLSDKPYEVVYVTWIYIILNEAPPLDLVGVAPETPWHIYTLLAMGLLVLTVFDAICSWQAGAC
jgi:hypothetical protein